MKKLTLVKLGGSVITDKNVPYEFRKKVVVNLAKQLKSTKSNLVIAHGSGSFGHTSATKYGGKKGYKNKLGIATVCKDSMEINRNVVNILVDEGIPAVSFRPISMIITNSGKINSTFFDPILQALIQGLIPVVCGDVVFDKKWKTTIYSGEKVLSQIAKYLINKNFKIDKIIQVGNTDGLYDSDNKTINKVSSKSWPSLRKFILKSSTKDVTGGMTQKIENALIIAKYGIKTVLINGDRKNELSNAILGKKIKGTVVKN